ncbi:hypothetical protein MNBD_ALPHA06-920 [hydrothermal vent metagenome]|uniref:Uncharacterized protein n=1 Tax=hydrothermal vent metagenome TaxID=652676 RepID=A0A3B0SQV6_9ZZZZ
MQILQITGIIRAITPLLVLVLLAVVAPVASASSVSSANMKSQMKQDCTVHMQADVSDISHSCCAEHQDGNCPQGVDCGLPCTAFGISAAFLPVSLLQTADRSASLFFTPVGFSTKSFGAGIIPPPPRS